MLLVQTCLHSCLALVPRQPVLLVRAPDATRETEQPCLGNFYDQWDPSTCT